MKIRMFLAIALSGGLCASSFADTESGRAAFDAKVKLASEEVKKAWPLDDPKSKAFYQIVAAMKADFQANNAWLFENANWPQILQRRAERELRMQRVRNAGKNPTFRSTFRPSEKSKLEPAKNLDSDIDLHSIYDRKDGKRRFLRHADEKKQ